MRKFLLLISFLTLLFSINNTTAQIVGCNDLFISEYIEGTGNNKCLEFFNPTSETINLQLYSLQRWSNGEAGMTDETQLYGTLAPLTTWVLVNGQIEDVELGGGAMSPACDPALQLLADQLDNPYPAPTYFNGNDALVLLKNGTIVVDIFGKPGEDPGTAWTNDVANGFTDVGDGAAWLTSNHTLRRKYEVVQGVTMPPVVFDTFLEYDTLVVNTWDGLGSHSCLCGTSGIHNIIQEPSTNVYPNPTVNGVFTIESDVSIMKIEVYSPEGRLVLKQFPASDIRNWQVSCADWDAGFYFVNLIYVDGTTFAHRIVIR
tara:strand:+ start:583 stop:1530 length:948 start_codon:yes stop_codon:yes gene_type:complete